MCNLHNPHHKLPIHLLLTVPRKSKFLISSAKLTCSTEDILGNELMGALVSGIFFKNDELTPNNYY